MYFKKIKSINILQGFTLVETLVAIFILSIAIAGAMTAASNGLRSSLFAKDRISAYLLAREALEMVRNKRDENGILNYLGSIADPSFTVDWLEGITSVGNPCENESSCGADPFNDTIVSCVVYDDCLLYKDNNGIFQHDNSSSLEPTPFTRKIVIEEISDVEVLVTVTVTWSNNFSYVVSEHIFDWHPLSS